MISFAGGKTSGEHLVRIYDRGEEKIYYHKRIDCSGGLYG